MAYKGSLLLFAVFLVGSQAAVYQRTVRYDDEVLVRCPTKVAGMKSFLESDDVDVWQVYADGMADVRLNKDLLETTTHAVAHRECTKIANVEELVQQAEKMTFREGLGADWFDEYHRYDDIVLWYHDQCLQFEEYCSFIPSIGKSVEGRDMPAVHVGYKSRVPEFKIYFQCQIHARDWITGATCMYLVAYFLNHFEDDNVHAIMEKVEIILIPFVNPDGYEYTWNTNRLWVKNRRQPGPSSSCYGVDLNRNYPDHWNQDGNVSSQCSETYPGPSAASEPETRNTIAYFQANAPIIGAIDWQAYGQLIIRPYEWTSADTPDEYRLSRLGSEMSEAIYNVHHEIYTSEKNTDFFGGSACDWFYGINATRTNRGYRAASYTFKLRDTGRYGFLLPPEDIYLSGQEIIQGVLVFAQSLATNPLTT